MSVGTGSVSSNARPGENSSEVMRVGDHAAEKKSWKSSFATNHNAAPGISVITDSSFRGGALTTFSWETTIEDTPSVTPGSHVTPDETPASVSIWEAGFNMIQDVFCGAWRREGTASASGKCHAAPSRWAALSWLRLCYTPYVQALLAPLIALQSEPEPGPARMRPRRRLLATATVAQIKLQAGFGLAGTSVTASGGVPSLSSAPVWRPACSGRSLRSTQ